MNANSQTIKGTSKLRSTLEFEATELLRLWKYIKNVIFNLRNDFDISCRLMMVLARDTFEHNTTALPDFVIGFLENWYAGITGVLCI